MQGAEAGRQRVRRLRAGAAGGGGEHGAAGRGRGPRDLAAEFVGGGRAQGAA